MIEHFSYEAEQAEAEYFTTQPQSELDQARKDIAELVEALERLTKAYRALEAMTTYTFSVSDASCYAHAITQINKHKEKNHG